VVKFGGTSLATPALVRNGAQHIARLVELGEQIVVVVSAPGNATSELLGAIYAASDSAAGFAELCQFAALGESQSVLLMTSALRSFGVQAQAFLPQPGEAWPIVADVDDSSPLSTGKVNEERPFTLRTQETASRFRRFVLPQLRAGNVPVIAGFFAQDSGDRIVALGRGGSDITAFIVAAHSSADEVVIVTDVQGVLSADPRLAANPRLHSELSRADLEVITSAGSRVLHPRALQFGTEQLKVRLMDYRELDRLEESGTSILGKSESSLYRNPDELAMLTLVGEAEDPASLHGMLTGWLAEQGLRPAGSSTSSRFICIYLPAGFAERAYAGLHETLVERYPELKNISLRGKLGELRLRSGKFLDQPGVLAEVTGVLANARINILEMITGLTDISLFIEQKDMDRAEALLSRVIEHYAG
jgi:aspartate kinase